VVNQAQVNTANQIIQMQLNNAPAASAPPVSAPAPAAPPAAPHDVATTVKAPQSQTEVAAPGGALSSRAANAAVQAPAVVSAPQPSGVQALLSAATSIFQPAQPAPVRATAASTTYSYPAGSTYVTPNGITYPAVVAPAATTFDPYARASAAASPGFSNPYPYPFSYGPYPLPNTNPPVASQPAPSYSYTNAAFFNGGSAYAPSYRPTPPVNPYSSVYDPYDIGTVRAYDLPFNIGPISGGAPYDLYGSRYPYASVYVNGVWYKPWEVPSQLGFGSNFYNPYAGGTIQAAGGTRRPLLPFAGFGGTNPYAPEYSNGIWHRAYETPGSFGYSGMSPYSQADNYGFGFAAGNVPFAPSYPAYNGNPFAPSFPVYNGNLLNGSYPFGGGYPNGVNYSYGSNLPFGTNVPYGSIYNYPETLVPANDTVQAYSNSGYANPAAYVAMLAGFGGQPGLLGLPSVAPRLGAPTQIPPAILGLPAIAQIPGIGSLRMPSVNALRLPWQGMGQMPLPNLFGNQGARPGQSSAQSVPALPVERGMPNPGLASPAVANAGAPIAPPVAAATNAELPSAILADSSVIFGALPVANQPRIAIEASQGTPVDAIAVQPSTAQVSTPAGPSLPGPVAVAAQDSARAVSAAAMPPEAAPFIVASMVGLPIEMQPGDPVEMGALAASVPAAVSAPAAAVVPAMTGPAVAPAVPVVAGAAAAAPMAVAAESANYGAAFVSILAVLIGLGLWGFSFFGLRRR
jgi:hypothetical protein